ncbi:MAG: tRNA (adenosine(37)-N6)-threonylcarbamoyltransferase complex ATPase subunit type 1 TsaE [Acidaminobacteraceae bacterium]
MFNLITKNEDETIELGKKIGALLTMGDIVCLTGDLGAGKTAITKAIARQLGIEEHVTSPTFTIVNQYYGKVNLNHFDVYRINHVDEMYDIGYEEYFYSEAINIVEWANLIWELIPDEHIWIDIRIGEDPLERIFTIKSKDKTITKRIEVLK